jgi:cell division protein FtsZ
VQEQAHEDANIIFGASIDETLGENVKVTVIATGFDAAEREAALEAQAHAPRQTLIPQNVPASPSRSSFAPPVPSSHMRPAIDAAAVPASRRPAHAHEVRTQAAAASHARPAVRERPAQDAFPNLEHDWDIPAFQRKQR